MDDDDKPTMTETELWEWLHYDEGIPVTRRAIKMAVINREIEPTRLGNGNFFSRRDGLAWLRSRKQAGAYSASKVPARQL
ncbi:hypothetical protein [Mycobacterium pseudokansasii]|uniref:Helix-turn-helix domain-containing protein n=1 Tax=Mycobacterium pseudokansasii TaxID=2341080 RepID=A0A498QMC3_9MYCO|nr:hypothetical protein [Mycobacterium pseudokansasii]VBA46732.1 hypothetical protein LAUMK142_00447 [Mycobacterium pseudokansasii]